MVPYSVSITKSWYFKWILFVACLLILMVEERDMSTPVLWFSCLIGHWIFPFCFFNPSLTNCQRTQSPLFWSPLPLFSLRSKVFWRLLPQNCPWLFNSHILWSLISVVHTVIFPLFSIFRFKVNLGFRPLC